MARRGFSMHHMRKGWGVAMEKFTGKIFVVGAPKTGTTSAGDALRRLGYDVLSWPMYRLFNCLQTRDLDALRRAVDAHDAFEDLPFTVLYKVLDAAYPGSRFILTIRRDERWIRSMVSYNGVWPDASRRFLMGYGAPGGFEAEHLDWYRRHKADVISHFAGRPDQLLIVDWESGDGWPQLAGFLGCAVPDQPFPHFKKTRYGSFVPKLNERLAALVRRARRVTGGPPALRTPDFDPDTPWYAGTKAAPVGRLWRPTLGFRLTRLISDRF